MTRAMMQITSLLVVAAAVLAQAPAWGQVSPDKEGTYGQHEKGLAKNGNGRLDGNFTPETPSGFSRPIANQEEPAGDTLRLSLEEAQGHAMEHNTQMKNARLDVKIADEEVWETTARGLPQVSASGSYNNNLSLSTQLFPNFIEPTIIQILNEEGIFDPPKPVGKPEKIEVKFGTQHNFDGSVTVNQLIFSGPYIVGLQASRVYKSLSQQRRQLSEQEVKANVTTTYHSIQLTRRNIRILKENMDNLEKSLNDSRAMYEQGMVEQTDVDQIQIQLSSLQNTINSTRRQLEQLQNMMKIQLGVELDKPVLLTQDLQDIIRNTQLDGSVDREFRVQENVSYQLMDTQVKLSELDLKRQKSQFLPSLSAFYNFRENAMRNKFNPLDGDKKWYESSTLGFQLSVPVFSSGQRISRVQQAKLNLQKTRNNLSETRKNLQNRFIQTKNNYHTAYDNYQTSRDNMNLARRVYERISKKYSEGMAGSMELTQANRDYLNAQSEYIRSLVELLNARTELDKILNEL